MSLFLQVEMFLLAIAILYVIIRMVNRHSFSVKRATPWLFIGFSLVFISLFPQVVSFVAHRAGFALTMNFLLFMAVLFLFILEIFDTTSSTRKEEQIKKLIQEVSLLKKEIEDKNSK
ncbi:DUF2304 domain-containing protein [Streptococcus pseudoporcinus]|uniref:PF10066 family protein n=1 Tax=Streptococcus pseudoporcinus LQ 940-04 TaxID=875093 RepID=G5K6S6_9STRE|nr:DUF2304 domain-containing protein [Streptococcus pseudoporcinus]EFR44225.1 hypothetical protein HMPREF9320_1824 [Streptococcus pseudoporcinus SPIN 20026]EHI65814.1 hypothetical protein STRPS_0163 [Streptococcus pseudoporcinus LQ 940-04]VEF94624.1 Integral membrane protein (Rhomboid family) [Streptococcus pseudoporcinus]